MKGRRPHIRLFFIKAVVKTKDLELVFKEVNSFPDYLWQWGEVRVLTIVVLSVP